MPLKNDALFPDENQLPMQYRNWQPTRQDYYLIDGNLRRWEGELQEVYSPVHTRTAEGCPQKLVGVAPQLTEAAALETLAVAVRAYSNGRGAWPTMSVGERIQCVQRFTVAMLYKRAEIIVFLQWEIGKSLQEPTPVSNISLQRLTKILQ